MFIPQPIKTKTNHLTGTVSLPVVRAVRHNSAGRHADKRLKRQGTRLARHKAFLAE